MSTWLKGAWLNRMGRNSAVAAAIILVVLGLALGVTNDNAFNAQKQREIGVQSQIVSASVAPALMFMNSANAQDYLSALAANPALQAAAVYDAHGTRIAAFNRQGEAPAPASVRVGPPRFEGAALVVVTPVRHDAEVLGAVYLRTDAELPIRRLARYAGIGILILLAALVLVILGISQGALAERARLLQQEIEQRERAEEALVQSRKLEAIGQLTGGVAHDFNNLLTVVLSGVRLMERNPTPERITPTLQAMRQAVERGASLTKQLLAFSRREALKLEATDIAAKLQGMRTLLERSVRADILVDIVIADALWAVKTDPAQFELALLNLVVNARDAMPKGGVLTITAQNKTEAGISYVEVSVKDTGMGMAPEVISRVFEPYFTTKKTGQGTGLGLSQVYGFATQSGGRVSIDSEVGQGTSVKLMLPRTDEIPAAPPAAPVQSAETINPSGKRVLVVEDDDTVASMVTEMIRQMGFRPTRVANAHAALAAVRDRCAYDLIFSDIIMPGEMNGIELARQIHGLYPEAPIILTTGYSGAPDVNIPFPVLRKPYQIEELEHAFTEALQR